MSQSSDQAQLPKLGSLSSKARRQKSNFYGVLGVPRKASQKEVKTAYRKLAQELHPDTNPAEDARALYELVNEAYDVLSDPGKRSTYDQGLRLRRWADGVKTVGTASTPLLTDVAIPLVKDVAVPLLNFTVRSAWESLGRPFVRRTKAAVGAAIEAGRTGAQEEADLVTVTGRVVQAARKAGRDSRRQRRAARARREAGRLQARAQLTDEEALQLFEKEAKTSQLVEQAVRDAEQVHAICQQADLEVASAKELLTAAQKAQKRHQASLARARKSAATSDESVTAAGQAIHNARTEVAEAKATLRAAQDRLATALQDYDAVVAVQPRAKAYEAELSEKLVAARQLYDASKDEVCKETAKFKAVKVRATKAARLLAAKRDVVSLTEEHLEAVRQGRGAALRKAQDLRQRAMELRLQAEELELPVVETLTSGASMDAASPILSATATVRTSEPHNVPLGMG